MDIKNRIVSATKWSFVTEVLAKLILPVTSMILARLLTPDAFGVVTSMAIIISFAEIFMDAGFQKYLIQHEFSDKKEEQQCFNVAFWSNLIMSIAIWILILFFSKSLSKTVGSEGYEQALILASLSLPITALSSIHLAYYKRALNYKALFKIRMISSFVPLLVTIPLALYYKNYWALIIGTLAQGIISVIMLRIMSEWKPSFSFSFIRLKEMLSFSVWSVFEAVSIWLTLYVDIFLIGIYLGQHYVGVYKTSGALVGQIYAIITSSMTPVLFSSLSRYQNDVDEFKKLFFVFQKITAIFVFPVGVMLFCFQNSVTTILLGAQWEEAALFVGCWGLSSAFVIVLSHYCSEVYRSMGNPKLSVLAQWLHLIALVPVVIYFARDSFETLCTARALVRIELVAVHFVIMYYAVRISPLSMLKNISTSCVAATVMAIFIYLVKAFVDSTIFLDVFLMFSAMSLYLGFMFSVRENRELLLMMKKNLVR